MDFSTRSRDIREKVFQRDSVARIQGERFSITWSGCYLRGTNESTPKSCSIEPGESRRDGMSLTHTIFSLPAAEQDAAIRLLARKNLQETGGGGLRAGFDGTIRRILHA